MFIGAAQTFNNALRTFISSLLQIRRNSILLQDLIALNKIEVSEKIFKTHLEKHSANNCLIKNSAPEIRFKNVSFSYPGQKESTLTNISLCIKPGENISLVGRNGAGKSTLIKLLAGLYKPSTGKILIDGENISDIPFSLYREKLAVVFQDFQIFNFSVSENICLAEENYNKSLIRTALEKAGFLEDVEALPESLNTLCGHLFESEIGTELSGGQKQKLATARASYRNAQILILDEPTSALDHLAEAETYLNFNNNIGRGKTSIYISHRLASCRFCNRIIFLDKGIIKENGSHDELIQQNGSYAQMFNLQKSQFQY